MTKVSKKNGMVDFVWFYDAKPSFDTLKKQCGFWKPSDSLNGL
jgi:hypothetical protein